MKPIATELRLNINPGEWYFGDSCKNIYTVLGSCVSLTAWHPKLKIGGLCHFLLPGDASDLRHPKEHNDTNSARYAKNALLLIKQEMLRFSPLNTFQISLFGGSNTLNHFNIGNQNIHYVRQWLHDENLTLHKIDVGGKTSRTIMLNLSTGAIIVKHFSMTAG